MSFTILYNKKPTFQAIKTRSSKSRKIDIFPKMAIFPTFFLANVGQENVFYHILQKKKAFFQAIKTRSSNNRKIDIFPKVITHGLGPKMAIFLSFFLALQVKKRCFMIFQNEKTPLEAIKAKRSKSRRIDIFPKGLTHGLSQKMAVFPTLFLGNIGQKNVFYDILQ